MGRLLSVRLSASFLALILVLLASVALALKSVSVLRANRLAVQHSVQTRIESERVLSLLKDAETGQRGFLLTGKPNYLEPYDTAVAQLERALVGMRSETAEEEGERERGVRLEGVARAKLAELSETIRVRREQGFEAAQRLVLEDRGKELMDQARSIAAEIERSEQRAIDENRAESARSEETAWLMLLGIGLFDLILLGIALVNVRRDFAERLKREQELRQSSRRFESLITASAQIVWTANGEGEIHGALPSWQAYTGQSEREIQGTGWLDAVHPDERGRVISRWSQARATESIFETEGRLRRADGEYRIFHVRGVPIVEDNAVREWIGSCTDVTDLRRKEAEILALNQTLERRVEERTEQLEEANIQLESFAYSVSHDLRAPLRAMRGFSQALSEDYAPKLDDSARQYLERISMAASKMDALILDLLSFSRLQRRQVALEPLDIAQTVEEARSALAEEIEQRKALLRIDACDRRVLGNRTVLIQVIANLISNAIKFVPADRQPLVRLWCESNGAFVRVWVEDNGIGIEPEHHQRIFNVFERLHGAESFPGTGIGLAIVRKGIERLGGQIGLESKFGEGSRFWFDLKSAEEQRSHATT